MLRRQNSAVISHPCFISFATVCLLALLRDVSGGRIRMTRIWLIVGLITSHRTYLTITKTRKGGQGPRRAVVPLMMMMNVALTLEVRTIGVWVLLMVRK
jgi:hypothetical protein